MSFTKYGALWGEEYESNPLALEMACVRKGGIWTGVKGQKCGLGLFYHYKESQKLMWPEDDHHRWTDLMLSEILANKHTVIIGPKDSGKTYCALARFGLTDYFMFPEITLILISSTDVRGLELRVWGALKDLWKRAKSRYDFLPGKPLESKHAICTDELNDASDVVRDMRKGIICIPCRSTSGSWLGINNYVGIKQKRRRLLSDEVQFMAGQFMDAPASLDGADFKGVYVGHPLGQSDPLDKLAEPKGGWGTEGEITKTTVWENKFNNGHTIDLVGTDSPNFDEPPDAPTKYPYLVNRQMIADTVAFYGMDSTQYWTKCLGIRKPGLMARRVITIKLCQDFDAFKEIIWRGTPRTKIYGIDAAYGAIGGDRCVGGYAEFGEDVQGDIIIAFHPPEIIPVSVRFDQQPEYQISRYVMDSCARLGIPPENVFFDSTGRGSLGSAFAVTWSNLVQPVEFGGSATDRPVSVDHFIIDPDTKQRRLKRCDEEFSKRVTEFWFMVRYCIESRQMRQLPRDVADEGCQREWKTVSGGRIEIETKEDMKERTGRSPDLFDWLCFEQNTKILTPFGEKNIEELQVGDSVITPLGTTRIAICHQSDCFHFSTVKFSNGEKLTGRGGHKVFTMDLGWKRLDCLVVANEIETVNNLPIWKLLNSLFTREENIVFKHQVNIIKTKTGAARRRDFFIDSFGKKNTALFLTVFVSIIKMVIGEITQSKIWNLWNPKNTLEIICESVGQVLMAGKLSWIRFLNALTPQLYGMAPRKDLNGIAKIAKNNGRIELSKTAFVANVGKYFWDSIQKRKTEFVPCVAKTEKQIKGRYPINEIVSYAATVLWLISMGRRKVVPSTVEQFSLQEPKKVYNLTLEEHNAYYANGILVDNCVTLEGARRRGFQIRKLGVATETESDKDFFETEAKQYREAIQSKLLQHR